MKKFIFLFVLFFTSVYAKSETCDVEGPMKKALKDLQIDQSLKEIDSLESSLDSYARDLEDANRKFSQLQKQFSSSFLDSIRLDLYIWGLFLQRRIKNYQDEIKHMQMKKNTLENEMEPLFGLQKIQRKKKDKINTPVSVQNIFVHIMPEFFEKIERGNPIPRIKSLIKTLFSLANMIHKEKNFYDDPKDPKTSIIKDDRKNHITRLVTNEFSFYTKRNQDPLFAKDFHEIVEYVEDLASKNLPNLTLVLSSFGIQAEAYLHNTVIHVQAGPSPKIRVFAKTSESDVDLFYSSNYPLNLHVNFRGDTMVSAKGFNVNRNSVFPCSTLGGAKYFDIIDICLDHYYGVAKNTFFCEKWRSAL